MEIQNDEAKNFFNKGLDPTFSEVYHKKGNSLNELKRYQEAIECFSKAIEFNPSFISPYNNKGLALVNLGRHQKAIECFSKALELDPTVFAAYNNKRSALNAKIHYFCAIDLYTVIT